MSVQHTESQTASQTQAVDTQSQAAPEPPQSSEPVLDLTHGSVSGPLGSGFDELEEPGQGGQAGIADGESHGDAGAGAGESGESDAGQDGAAATGEVAGQAGESTQAQGLRERLAQLGVPVDQWQEQDESQLLEQLAQSYQRAARLESERQAFREQYAPQINEFMQSREDFLRWREQMRQGQQPASPPAQQQQQQQPWYAELWNPPQYDSSEAEPWIEVDASGKRAWKANTPPDVIRRATEHARYTEKFVQEFTRNPYEFVVNAVKHSPLMDELRQVAQAELGTRDLQQQVRQLEAQNADWIYMQDEHGQIARDALGNPVPTVWGRQFAQYLSDITASGVTDPVRAWNLAQRQVQADMVYQQQFYMQQQQAQAPQQMPAQGQVVPPPAEAAFPQTPQQAQQQANMAFLQSRNRAERSPSHTGNAPAPGTPSQGATTTGLSLHEKMTQAFQQAGFLPR